MSSLLADPGDEGRASGSACSFTQEDRKRQFRIEADQRTILSGISTLGTTVEDWFQRLYDEVAKANSYLAGQFKPFYTVAAAAQLLDCSEDTVRRWIHAGKLKAERVPGTGARGRLRIPRESLQELLNNGLGDALPPAFALGSAAQQPALNLTKPDSPMASPSESPADDVPDSGNEARDRWIHGQYVAGVRYSKIQLDLKEEHPEWEYIVSRQGILAAADRYADRQGWDRPKRRRRPFPTVRPR